MVLSIVSVICRINLKALCMLLTTDLLYIICYAVDYLCIVRVGNLLSGRYVGGNYRVIINWINTAKIIKCKAKGKWDDTMQTFSIIVFYPND